MPFALNRLDEADIAAFSVSEEPATLADGGGLYLARETSRQGTHCRWMLSWKGKNGRWTMRSLGTWPAIQLAEARRVRNGYRACIDQGPEAAQAWLDAWRAQRPRFEDRLRDGRRFRKLLHADRETIETVIWGPNTGPEYANRLTDPSDPLTCRCRALAIPIPPLGFWKRLDARGDAPARAGRT